MKCGLIIKITLTKFKFYKINQAKVSFCYAKWNDWTMTPPNKIPQNSIFTGIWNIRMNENHHDSFTQYTVFEPIVVWECNQYSIINTIVVLRTVHVFGLNKKQ